MAKPIPQERKDEFLAFCRERYEDEDILGAFSLECLDFIRDEDEEGNELWEFHAANYQPETSHDIYELFESVQPEFVIETHGHDDFYVTKPDE
jgi:hypothetical protein